MENKYSKRESVPIVDGKSFEYYRHVSTKEGFPMVSLIVPTYNLKNFISETVSSIKAQTASSDLFEVLFVDDCSIDGTRDATISEMKGLQNAFSIKTPQNLGAWNAKNYGVRSSRGKYVMLLDGDDFLEPDAIKSTLEFMASHPEVAYSYSQHRKIDEAGRILYTRYGVDYSREKLLEFNFIGAVECFKRSLFDDLEGFRNFYVEDYDFALRASELLNPDQISRNPEVLYNHRLHIKGKTNGADKARSSAMEAIRNSILRKEGLEVEVKFQGKNEENNTCFSWQKVA
ncbi:MAG: glycosyltransferase [Nanoarchaeota archaeon]|nr:glycosyltransferase [Nanoarchaeota archaeon]